MTTVNSVNSAPQAESFRLWGKKRMLEMGITVTELAKNLKLSRVAVSTALNHETMYPGVKERIRKALTES